MKINNMSASQNITYHMANITQSERQEALRAKGAVIWLTGLSGSGKSTIARALEKQLVQEGHFSYVLDGDNLRFGLNSDLGFSAADRSENIRRVGEVTKLFAESCVIVIAAFISPFQEDRQAIRMKLPEGRFVEVHVATSLSICEQRDPKGLYRKARTGEIDNFTGISAPYEEPLNPELRLETANKTIAECVGEIITMLHRSGLLLSKL